MNKTSLGIETPPGPGNALGFICTSTYLTAKVPVNVSISSTDSVVSVDREAFNRNKRKMDSTFLTSDTFENAFLSETGTNHLRYANNDNIDAIENDPPFDGPLLAVAAKYNLSIGTIMGVNNLPQVAAVVKQRFFGEIIQSVFSDLAQTQNIDKTSVLVAHIHTRLVADFGIGIGIGSLLLLLAVAAIAVLYLTRLGRRPLQLQCDPNTATAAALMIEGTETPDLFQGLDRTTVFQIKETFRDHAFAIRGGKLLQVGDSSTRSQLPVQTPRALKSRYKQVNRNMELLKARYTKKDWRPLSLRRWSGALLALFLTSILGTLITIYAVSHGPGLHESAFVYEDDVTFGTRRIVSLAPYRIIPTLVAVLIKLWWAALENAFRRLSPFLAMVQGPRHPSDGAALSYVTTPTLWITAVAARKGHWFLALVTFGAFTTEVLHVRMSALWTREPGALECRINLKPSLEIRSVPHVFEGSVSTSMVGFDTEWPHIEPYLYGGSNFYGSWLFTGLVQSAYNASAPPWSMDGWAFPPVDLINATKAHVVQDTSSPGFAGQDLGPSLNVTLNGPGLRGRIECIPFQNMSGWVLIWDLTNGTQWNVSANPTDLHTGYELSDQVRFGGFANDSDNSSSLTLSIGQWLRSGYSFESNVQPGIVPPTNFTVLWINADSPLQQYWDTGNESHAIFKNAPQVQALNCMPVFETANARITVDAVDGTVAAYQLLDTPRNASEAWNSAFETHWANETHYREDNGLGSFNNTVSWGYLFQLTLLEASNILPTQSLDKYEEGNFTTPFSFKDADLNADFYSFSAFALSNNNRSAMLDAATLMKVSQRAFSTFFQNFVSHNNSYNGYWAWQPIGATVPFGLDFEEPVTISSVFTSTVTYPSYYTSWYTISDTSFISLVPTASSFSVCMSTFVETTYPGGSSSTPGSTSMTVYTTTTVTETAYPSGTMRTSISTSTMSQASSFSTAQPTVLPFETASSSAPLLCRTAPTSTSASDTSPIPATLSIRVQLLVVSPLAIFLCIAILAFLLGSTIVVYAAEHKHLKMLRRDVDVPASVFASVYGSQKLRHWVREGDERGQFDGGIGSERSRSWKWRMGRKLDKKRRKRGEQGKEEKEDEGILVGMGYFTAADDSERWGIEVDAETMTEKYQHDKYLSIKNPSSIELRKWRGSNDVSEASVERD